MSIPVGLTPETPRLSWELLNDTLDNPYIPQEPTLIQLAFLELECRDVLFGGAGGGGKSSGLLMAALQFAHLVPGYSALIVRRHFADLKLPGGLIDRSLEWLNPHVKSGAAKWNPQEHRWRFKNGATLQFGYADKEGDEQRYHGAEFQFCALDEGVQFTEPQIRFFAGERLRRKAGIDVPLRFRLATTPGGPGHEFLKRRYISPGTPGKVFLPAKLADNPHLRQEEYVESLQELEPLRRKQILEGDWDAVAGGRFQREWLTNDWEIDAAWRDHCILRKWNPVSMRFEEAERFNWKSAATFQTCDPSASASNSADYFVLSTWKLTPKGNLVWWACERTKAELPEQIRICQSSYRIYRPQFLAVEAVLNQRGLLQMLQRSTSPAMVVKKLDPKGRDKLNRAAGAIVLASSGRLFLPAGGDIPTFEDVRSELVRFTGLTDNEASDIVDTLAYACELLPTVRPTGGMGSGSPPFRYPGKGDQWSGLR